MLCRRREHQWDGVLVRLVVVEVVDRELVLVVVVVVIAVAQQARMGRRGAPFDVGQLDLARVLSMSYSRIPKARPRQGVSAPASHGSALGELRWGGLGLKTNLITRRTRMNESESAMATHGKMTDHRSCTAKEELEGRAGGSDV